MAGAEVVAAVRNPAVAAELTALGAATVVTTMSDVGAPVHGVLDTVGGPQLMGAFELLADGGVVQSIGAGSGSRP